MISGEPILTAVQVWASLRPLGVMVEEEVLTGEAVEVLHRAGVQAILAIGGRPSKFAPTALNNFVAVGRLAGKHLADKGHRHIAVLVPRDPRLLRLGQERLQGVEEVGRLHGLRIERVDLNYDIAEARRLVEQWRQGARPSAVFTYNDEYAMLLMRALQDAGFSVPNELALVGCDNLPLCELLCPTLTSIRIGPEQDGAKEIADFLDGLIRGTVQDQQVLYLPEPELIPRASS
jgi:DNA-binding LacI/PurR family transcriptional regulator